MPDPGGSVDPSHQPQGRKPSVVPSSWAFGTQVALPLVGTPPAAGAPRPPWSVKQGNLALTCLYKRWASDMCHRPSGSMPQITSHRGPEGENARPRPLPGVASRSARLGSGCVIAFVDLTAAGQWKLRRACRPRLRCAADHLDEIAVRLPHSLGLVPRLPRKARQ